MFILCTLSFLTLFLAGISAAPSLSPKQGEALVARAGPSGSVVYPPGGTGIYNPGGTEYIFVNYLRVDEDLPDYTHCYTVGIDLYLESMDGSPVSFDPVIANRFGATGPTNANILGYFVPPPGACGTYRLVFMEHQVYEGKLITFRAAAPTIEIQCGPFQG